MSKNIWQAITTTGILAIALGMIPGGVQACGYGGCTPSCGSGDGAKACLNFDFVKRVNNQNVGTTTDTDVDEAWEPDLVVQATAQSAWSSNGNGGTLSSATVKTTSYGLGVQTTSGESIYLDNSGSTDSILFNFSTAVELTSLKTGLVSGDSDFSVWAWLGAADPITNLAGTTYSTDTTTNNGWRLIGSYNAGSAGTTSITTDVTSSYWLIGAYNGTNTSTLDKGDDYFKILALGAACPVPDKQVPEPGTLLLMGAGMLGLMRLNSRRVVRSAV